MSTPEEVAARDERQTWGDAEQPDPLEPCVGNPAYEAHIERVVSAAVGGSNFSYLQTNLAILVDRDQRAHEGYRRPRTITTIGGLGGEADGVTILTAHGKVMQRVGRYWATPYRLVEFTPIIDWLPATVLHEPEAS